MCDSMGLIVRVDHIDIENHPGCLPLLTSTDSNQDGEIVSRTVKKLKVRSPLTNAKYEIHPVVEMVQGSPVVRAYRLSINMPACTVKNNALVALLVWLVAVMAREMLKGFLLGNGCPWEVVKQVTLDKAEIVSLDLPFLVVKQEGMSADNCLKDVDSRARSLKKSSHAIRHGGAQSVIDYNELDRSVTVKSNLMEVCLYCKESPGKGGFCDLDFDAKNEIFVESSKFIRVEARLRRSWFKKNEKFSKPANWRNGAESRAMYGEVFDDVRKLFMLDVKYRERAPYPDHKKNLSPAQIRVLEAYLDGTPLKGVEALQGTTKQYFSKVKKALREELNIDLDIPWGEHANLPPLKWLKQPPSYKLPDHLKPLADFVFCRDTAKAKIEQLKAEVKKLRKAQPTSGVD